MNESIEPITIVVPVLNREQLILRCLNSIEAQTYRPLHVVVVDNGSSDNTVSNVASWIQSHSRIDFQVELLKETTPGAAAARNAGLRHCTTDKIIFFDSDDEMQPMLVQAAMERFIRPDSPDLVHWNASTPTVRTLNKNYGIRPTDATIPTLRHIKNHLYHSVFAASSLAVKTAILKEIGGWNKDLRTWDDYELGIRYILQNPRTAFIDQSLLTVYPQEESITGTDFSSKAGTWEASLSASEHAVASSHHPYRKQILSMLTYRRINLAALYSREGRIDLGSELLKATLATLSPTRRLLARIIYHYTRFGGRGASRLWPL